MMARSRLPGAPHLVISALLACSACGSAPEPAPALPILTWSYWSHPAEEESHVKAAAEFSDYYGEMCTIKVEEDLPLRLHALVQDASLVEPVFASAMTEHMLARLTLPNGSSMGFDGFRVVRDLDGQTHMLSDAQTREVAEEVIGAILSSPRCADAHDYFRSVLTGVRNDT